MQKAANEVLTNTTRQQSTIAAYWELCKPRVVALMLLTALVGMHLAAPGMVPPHVLIYGILGIALCAGSAACINHIVDQRIDIKMGRTKNRPLPTGKVSAKHALIFSLTIGIVGFLILYFLINQLTAILTFITLIGYAVFYTMFLKYLTPQNIVIGGAAGAAPPLLGWVAVTGHVDPYSLLLVLIIFMWTPPHFWALAIYRRDDYAKAKVPMLPVTHGVKHTKLNVLLYTILMFACSLLPYVTRMSGLIYAIGCVILGARFTYWAIKLFRSNDDMVALKTFRFSIIYLFVLFILILVDHYFFIAL